MNTENFSEKVSVNINSSTLSSIDLLVDNGYYSNRSDFINQSLREGLQKHQNTIDRIIEKKTEFNSESPNQWFIGVYGLEKQEIEKAKSQGKEIGINMNFESTGISEEAWNNKLEEIALYAFFKISIMSAINGTLGLAGEH